MRQETYSCATENRQPFTERRNHKPNRRSFPTAQDGKRCRRYGKAPKGDNAGCQPR